MQTSMRRLRMSQIGASSGTISGPDEDQHQHDEPGKVKMSAHTPESDCVVCGGPDEMGSRRVKMSRAALRRIESIEDVSRKR